MKKGIGGGQKMWSDNMPNKAREMWEWLLFSGSDSVVLGGEKRERFLKRD